MSSGIRWTEEEYEEFIRKYARDNRAAVQAPDLERHTIDAVSTKDSGKKVDQKFRIHFHSKRRRLIDPDGLYSKAAIDGLREGAILEDDSAKHVTGVSYSQERSKVEETIIEVWEVKE